MRDVSVASRVDSADFNDVEEPLALPEERMHLRQGARRTLYRSAGEIDLKVLGQVIRAYRDRDAHRLEQVSDRARIEGHPRRHLHREHAPGLAAHLADQRFQALER